MKYFLFTAIFFLATGVSVFAQSDTGTFNIRVFGGADITPPTTPILLSANPMASTQIDLTWSSSTDNFSLSGYTIQRDGLPIATTTLLSYSDGGLLASTTYSYSVRAFDQALNYSTTSNIISTTTLDVPIIPEVEDEEEDENNDSSQGTSVRVVLRDLQIEVGHSTSSIQVVTARPARLEIRWGRSDAYELGYVVSSIYKSDSNFLLTDLEPGTTYEYEIVGYAPSGIATVLATDTFTTQSEVINQAPANVLRFQANAYGNDVRLRWELLTQNNIEKVRIVRSHLGFPEHPTDGAIIYQGLGTGVSDLNILEQYSPVYYTAFVYDFYGNVSSGAVAVVYASFDSDYTTNQDVDFSNAEPVNLTKPIKAIAEATTSVNQARVTPQTKMPKLGEIFVTQGTEEFSLSHNSIELDSGKEFTISVPKDSVSNNLKSIIVTVVDPTDTRKGYSFLLRLNKNRDAYEAVVAALNVLGKSQILLEVYDYEAYVVGSYQTPFTFVEDKTDQIDEVVFPDAIFDRLNIILSGILLLCVIILVVFIIRRKAEDNN